MEETRIKHPIRRLGCKIGYKINSNVVKKPENATGDKCVVDIVELSSKFFPNVNGNSIVRMVVVDQADMLEQRKLECFHMVSVNSLSINFLPKTCKEK